MVFLCMEEVEAVESEWSSVVVGVEEAEGVGVWVADLCSSRLCEVCVERPGWVSVDGRGVAFRAFCSYSATERLSDCVVLV